MSEIEDTAVGTEQNTPPGLDTKPCPLCGETIKSVAIKCRFCGEDLQAYAQKQEAAVEKTVYEGRPAAIHSAIQYFWITITFGIAAFVYWFRSRCVRYKITTQRIIVEEGFLTTKVNNIELYRIDDVEIEYPFTMRVLGYGNLHLKSSDRDRPDLVLWGLTDAMALFETVRDCNIRERERRGIKVFTQA